MMTLRIFAATTLFILLSTPLHTQGIDSLRLPQENHLRNVRQLTFGGENAEAYFSFREDCLILQSTIDSFQCDQIYSMDLLGSNLKLMSSGKGRTTCAYYLPGDTTFIYSSTHLSGAACPPRPDYSKGYVWAVYKSYDIFLASTSGGILRQLTSTPGYDAEATVSPLGDKIVFTSVRDGDLDLYSMDIDGSNVKRLTNEVGYDGGAFYTIDGKQIVYRGYHPTDSSKIAEYQNLLNDGFVRPSEMELYIMNADGSHKTKLTSFGGASFAPFPHSNGKQIIFASNMNDPKGRNFDLYLINFDGTGLERITFNETFDGFPMFSRDGKKLVFASNRHAKVRGETNIFIADWVP